MPKENKTKDRKRNSISLELKIKILDCLARGEGSTSVGKKFGFNEATIRTIKKHENNIRNSVMSGSKISAKISSYSRDTILENTEKLLVIWMEDASQKRIPVDGNTIKQKALRIYERLQDAIPSTSSQETEAKKHKFSASDGWLTGFLKRYAFHNVKIKGESSSADEVAAKSYPETLKKIIQDGGYGPDQIFNAGNRLHKNEMNI